MSIGPQSSYRSELPLTPTEHYAAVAEELGAGTTICFTLPAPDEPDAPDAPDEEAATSVARGVTR